MRSQKPSTPQLKHKNREITNGQLTPCLYKFIMKVRRDFWFSGLLLLIAHLIGETHQHSQGFGSFSVVITVLQFSGSAVVHCTQPEPPRSFAPQANPKDQDFGHDFHTNGDEIALAKQREPRLIKELTMMNRQSCMSKILCGVEVAKPPSSGSSTINDYAFIVKSFFDVFSLGDGNKKKKTSNKQNDDADPESDETKEEDEIDIKKTTTKKRKYTSSLRGESDVDLVASYNDDLESLLNEPDSLFKKRSGRGVECVANVTRGCRNGKILKPGGFMGYSNPRFDKTAFLDRKQLEIERAPTTPQKLQISSQIAAKLRSPRQCRLLNWLRPSTYTTTTTITTTSNDPTVSQTRNEETVNSMCPFSVRELQAMISGGSKQGIDLKPTTAGQVGSSSKIQPTPKTPPPYRVVQYIQKPLKLTEFGETDPELELVKDPFYALVPPEPTTEQFVKIGESKFQAFTQPGTNAYQKLNPSNLPFGHQGPSLQNQNYHLSTDGSSTTGSQYSKYFYLNADDPSTTPGTSTLKTTKKPEITKPTKQVNSEEDDEDDDEKNDSDEDTINSDMDSHPRPPPPLTMVQNPTPTQQQTEKLLFRIPSKIYVSLPSFRRIAAKFRNNRHVRHSQKLHAPRLDPVNAQSDESQEKKAGNRKREAQKQLVFKTNLDYSERVKDQHSPEFILSRTPPVPVRLPPPPLPPKSKEQSLEKDEENDSEEGEDDEEDEERSLQPKQMQKLTRNKSQKTNKNAAKNTTSVLHHFLSDHGMRSLSMLTDLFYGPREEDEAHPHDHDEPPPPPRRKHRPPPPRKRRRGPSKRRRPRPPQHHPQQDQDQSDNNSEEDDEDGSSEEKETTTKKPPPTTTPPAPLHPLQIPPRVVAVPIYLEGKEDWEGLEKPHEEEFFEPKPKKSSKNKPEKYDYDYADSVESSTNSKEGIDFGPGQGIKTEYSEIVDGVVRRRPGNSPHTDRFVLGLPTTWESMFKELKRQKQIEKWVEKHKKKENKKKNDSGEEEEEEDDEDVGPPPPKYSSYRPPPSHFNLEPID